MSKYDLDNEPTDTLNAEQKAFESGANDNVIARSLRGGMYGAGSQLLSAGAGAADALGADGVGAGLHTASRGLRDQAALPGNSPRVSSFKQLREAPSLDNVGEYMGGLVGGSLPATALGIAGGVVGGRRGLLAGMAGAGAATTPLNVGEIVQKQQDDPEAMQQSAGSRFGDAVLGGVGASAVESIVPGLVGRQILGRGLGNLGKESVKQIVGRNALDIPMEGLAEGAGTAVKQFATNQSAPLDWEEIGEGAIGGAAAGSVFTGVGTAADLARMPGNRMGEALTSARTSINDRLAKVRGQASEKLDAAGATAPGKKVKSAFDDISDMVERGKSKFDDAVDRMMNGGLVGVADADVAGATPERVKEFMAQSAAAASAKVQEWGSEMLGKMVDNDPRRQAVVDAMAAGGERAGQMAMAGLKKSFDAAESATGKLRELSEAVGNGFRRGRATPGRDVGGFTDVEEIIRPDQSAEGVVGTPDEGRPPAEEAPAATPADRDAFMANEMTGGMSKRDASKAWEDSQIKKSQDYSGIEEAVLNALTSTGLAKRRPELFSDPGNVNELAGNLRIVLEQITKGQLDAKVVKRLTDLLGEDTDGIINSMRRAIKGDLDPGEAEAYFNNINALRSAHEASSKLNTQLKTLMGPEQAKRYGGGYDLMEVADLGLAYARGELTNTSLSPSRATVAADAAANAKVRELFVQRFGANADAALDLLGQHAGMAKDTLKNTDEFVELSDSGAEAAPSEGGFDEDGERVNPPQDFETIARKGRGASNEPVMDPALFRANKEPGQNHAAQYILEMQKAHPELEVKFELAEGSKTHGYVTVKKARDDDALSEVDIEAMYANQKYPNSKDRIKAGDRVFDSRSIVKAMKKRVPPSRDGMLEAQRLKEVFETGVARLIERVGTFEVPDTVVLGRVGGKDLTYGAAKKLDVRTNADRAADALTQEMNDLRIAYRNAKTDGAPKETLAGLRASYMVLLEAQAADVDAELAYGEDIQERSGRSTAPMRQPGPGTARTKDEAVGATRVDNGGGEDADATRDPDKAGNIHETAQRLSGEKLVNRSNMDGTGRWAKGREARPLDVNLNGAVMAAAALRRAEGAPAQKIAARLSTMLDNADSLSAKDARILATVQPGMTPSKVAEIINDLARKYKGSIVPPDVGAEFKEGAGAEARKTFDRLGEGERTKLINAVRRGREVSDADKDALKASLEKQKDAEGLARFAREALEKLEGGPPNPKARAAQVAAPSAGDADTNYALTTKRYSLLSTAIHSELGRDGFAATHDSPIRHEGKFDWRAHIGKGEGQAVFGAGTYLSTADGVHRSYKEQFTAQMNDEEGTEYSDLQREMTDAGLDLWEAKDNLDQALEARKASRWNEVSKGEFRTTGDLGFVVEHDGEWSADFIAVHAENGVPLGTSKKSLQEVLDAMLGEDETSRYQEIHDEAQLRVDKIQARMDELGPPEKSPTYEVSVGIKPEQLLDWDAPLYEQSQHVRDALDAAEGDVPELFVNDLTGKSMYAAIAKKLGTQAKASEYLQSLGILGHKYASSGGRNDTHPNYVIYDDSKITTNYVHFSAQSASASANVTAAYRKTVEAHVLKVLGPKVGVEWKNLTHAGEFQRMRLRDIIRISVHALDPMSVAYHESLHGFFAQLRDVGATDVMNALDKAASSPLVIDQLKARFASQPAVLAQLKDPEERVAYMYQMWATDPSFRVAPSSKGALRRVADFIRKVLGIWSNDQKALHIMEYFHSGEYAKTQPSVAAAAMAAAGRNPALDNARELVKPMTRFADAVAATGSGRMRDTEIPALVRLADLIKREHTDERGGDQGFIPAARVERTKRLNELGNTLMGYEEATLAEAHEALISNTRAPSPEARLAVRAIKDLLAQTREYMVKAGVEVGDLGADYFPRVWDFHYISKNQQAFKDMLEPHVRSGAFKGNVDDFIRAMAARDGVEENVVSTQPGMQFKKERLLSFISPAEAAPFVDKELLGTLSKYVTQATRKAEWHRRLGDGKLEAIMEGAKKEGASKEDLELATNYMRGVDGTLGDTMNPHLRRITGNMIVYQNIRLLPLAVFSSIVDPVGIMVRGGTVGDAWTAFKRGIAEIPQSYGRAGKADSSSEAAELIGAIDSAMLTSVMGDIYTQGMVGGVAQKINTAFFKYNLMEGLNRSFRVGATEAAMRFVVRHHAGGTAHSARWMAELGLKAGDIKVMPDGRPALTAAEGLSAEQERRVHAALNQWVDGAVLRPDAADKPLWMNDPRWALVSHLKQFVYSFQKVILARVVHEIQRGNYTPLMALAAYVPVMIAADFAKGALQGGGDQPEWKKGWDMGDYLSHGVQRAGLLGVGQFGVDVSEDMSRGGSGLGALVGPTIEQFGDVVQVLGGQREFGSVALKSMPANALYAEYARNGAVDDGGAGRSE